MNLYISSIFLLSCVAGIFTANAEIYAETGKMSEGRYRFFYDEAVKSYACNNIVFIGVGTAMSVSSYDKIASEIAQSSGALTVITDHNARFPVKTSGKGYAKLLNRLMKEIDTRIPICATGTSRKIIVGGHSASGQAAVESIPKLDFTPDGFIGLDPFRRGGFTGGLFSKKVEINIPSFEWGFTKTTCFVNVDQAAKSAYEASDEAHRILYRVSNTKKDITHCIFTDNGCPTCPAKESGEWVRKSVGETISVFIKAVSSSTFNKAKFVISEPLVELYANDEKA